MNPIAKKIQNYRTKLVQHIWRMNRDNLPHLIMKYQVRGKRIQEEPSQDFSKVNGTGTGHEA
jgi:hypothetical protein